MWQCLKSVAAIAGGAIVAAGTGNIEAGTAVGAAIGAAEIIQFFGEQSAKHGPESAAYLSKIQTRVVNALGSSPSWDGFESTTVAGWDWSLSQALPACMLDRNALAAAFVDHQGFIEAATSSVMIQLAVIEPIFAGGSAAAFARQVVVEALTAAYDEKAYFEDLTPHLWAVTGKTLGQIKSTADETAAGVKLVLAEAQIHREQFAEFYTWARQQGVFQQTAAQGLSDECVRKIVEKLGGRNIDKEELAGWLEDWVNDVKEVLSGNSDEGAAFAVARTEAVRRFKAGQNDDVSDPFMELLQREQAEAKHRQITIIEEAIRFDMLALNVAGVVAKTKLLATANGATDLMSRAQFLIRRAGDSYETGRVHGNNLALRIAIETCRLALEDWTRQRLPQQWAAVQSNLAMALCTLGTRENGTGRLEEAAACARLALEEQLREKVPIKWASTQTILAEILKEIGDRESDTTRIEEAVACYHMALEERTRERVPLEWAMVQMNLGNALLTLYNRKGGPAQLEEAMTCYRSALLERTREKVPLAWATLQMNLGNALSTLGKLQNRTERLEEAAVCYRSALEEITREKAPLQWAALQRNLGSVFRKLGARESGTTRHEEAVACYSLALEEQTRDRVPVDWATTCIGLAIAKLQLADLNSDLKLINDAEMLLLEARPVAEDFGQTSDVAEADRWLTLISEFRAGLDLRQWQQLLRSYQ